jgi:hypothetical protein
MIEFRSCPVDRINNVIRIPKCLSCDLRYGFLHDEHLRHGYHKALASYVEKMPTCQRRIDELPVQLECCSMWSQLQACLVDMKMFQLWWHEHNRHDFLAYWKTLRSYFSMHDPVDDFIRSLDDYVASHGPCTEDLLSLFLTVQQMTLTLRSFASIERRDIIDIYIVIY